MGDFLDKAGEVVHCFGSGSSSLVPTLPRSGLITALEERATAI